MENDEIYFQFYGTSKKSKNLLTIPLSDFQFRESYTWSHFDKYLAFEELMETDYFSENQSLPISNFYELIENEDFKPILERMGLPVVQMPVKVEIQMTGNSGHEPEFEIFINTNEGIDIRHLALVEFPFIKMSGETYYLNQSIWDVYKAAKLDSFDHKYEQIAKIQKISNLNDFDVDDFLTREKYEYIEEYDLQPTMLDDNTMLLKIVGESDELTSHLNNNNSQTTIKNSNERTRIVSSQQVREDINIINQKKILKGEEIPQFFQNPLSLFPEHEFQFDLESFSKRVIGFVEIKKPRMQYNEGKYSWFDDESGEKLDIDMDELRKDVAAKPNSNFIKHKKMWIFVDNTLRKELNLIDDEEKSHKSKLRLDILDNEENLGYSVSNELNKQFKDFPVPSTLNATLYDYQIEGFRWIASLADSNSSGLLADDMGLGKTMQVITFLLHQQSLGKFAPTLIVLPIALIENWENEINKFAPSLSNKIYIHQGPNRIRNHSILEKQELIFISYDTLKIDQLLFGRINFQNIIADEAQNIKNHSSERSRALRAMKSEFRLAMTGTPVENSLEELWTIMDFVQPGAMFSLNEFKKSFIKNSNVDLLMKTLKPYYLRRTKKEVLSDKLPSKHILAPTYLQASRIQKNISETMLQSIHSKRGNMLTVIGNLRQLYAHPGVFEHIEKKVNIDDAPKLKELITLLDKVKISNEKILIFTEFRKVQSILKKEISSRYGVHVPIIDGNTKNRSEVVKDFGNQTGFGVMLLSPKAAGVGLTITSANHVLHYTRWWNPAVENQSTDRAYRIGQTKDVYVYQIITQDKENFPNGTVEEIMHQMLIDKSELAENVIIPFDTKLFKEQLYSFFEK
ncbi:DEAD/DEAH box helicase [Paenisporosarcina antarctica]|uniref:DEAD/DEAH box helicase n=1 Tax=Paenisporosarcina antarctica TaxID=417367 RepID=A0A4P7A1V8_9BACL|nr:DEAD/DEAH box helicase [Paenisporosarcina antarctica]QBP42693.1 DEAD/DEAH box helicase [Paenisporosarcina antarctica]